MSIKFLKLKIVTPERTILEEDVEQVTLPTSEGEITVLPGHVPLISTLRSGEIAAKKDGEYIPMAVVGGFIEVKQNSGTTEVAVLADYAESISAITEDEIEKAKARSIELAKLAENKEHVDFEHFATELERSLTRVKIADKWRSKKYRK